MTKVPKQFSTHGVFQYHVQFIRSLESIVQLDDKRMPDFLQDLSFSFQLVGLVDDEGSFLEDLHSVELFALVMSNQMHLAEPKGE
jgi:hypothetical protein